MGTYLRARGLGGILDDPPDHLFEHPSLNYVASTGPAQRYPALVAIVSSADGEMVSLHRTYLYDGAKAEVEHPRKLCSPTSKDGMRGAAIRLYPPTDVLAIAEGIESALAVRVMTGLPVWSGVTASLLRNISVPSGVRQVEIWSDHDDAGLSAAVELRDRLTSEGRDARIVTPPAAGMDPLDLLNSIVRR